MNSPHSRALKVPYGMSRIQAWRGGDHLAGTELRRTCHHKNRTSSLPLAWLPRANEILPGWLLQNGKDLPSWLPQYGKARGGNHLAGIDLCHAARGESSRHHSNRTSSLPLAWLPQASKISPDCWLPQSGKFFKISSKQNAQD